VGTRLRLPPRQGVQAVGDVDVHELVPGGVELDLVDAVAEAVVGAQLRRVLVGEPAELDRLAAARDRPDRADRVHGEVAALPRDRLDEGPVRLEDVVVLERGRLIRDLVRCLRGARRGDCHGLNPTPGGQR